MESADRITPAAYNVIICMAYRGEVLGVNVVTKHELARVFGLDRGTVLQALRGFESRGWVESDKADESNGGLQRPTMFSLTASAPSLAQLMGTGEEAL